MQGDVTATSVMLGLPGFRVLAVSEHAGELEQAVETTAEEGWCPACGVRARLHDRRPSWVRDLPAARSAGDVGVGEADLALHRVRGARSRRGPRHRRRSARGRRGPNAPAGRRAAGSGEDGHTVAAVAAEFGVGWATVMTAVRDYGLPLVDDPNRLERVHTLGVDETAFLAATPTSGTAFATGIVALNGRAAAARRGARSQRKRLVCLGFWPRAGLARQHRGHRVGPVRRLRHRAAHHPAARRCGCWTRFTSCKLGFDAVDQVRRRVQQETTGHRGRRDDPLYRIRRVLRRGFDHHSPAVLGSAARRAGRRRRRPADRPGVDRRPGAAAALPRTRPATAPSGGCCAGSPPSPSTRSPNCSGSRAPWTCGGRSCSPTSTPAASPTAPPKPSTDSSRRSRESGTATATSTTTGSACSCTAASTGTLPLSPRSEGGYHA